MRGEGNARVGHRPSAMRTTSQSKTVGFIDDNDDGLLDGSMLKFMHIYVVP